MGTVTTTIRIMSTTTLNKIITIKKIGLNDRAAPMYQPVALEV